MTQSDYNRLLQTAFDRELNERELDQVHNFLGQNTTELADFEAVDQLLAKLPDVHISHNFTSLVMHEARCEINNLDESNNIVDLSWSRFFTSKYRLIRLVGAASIVLFIGLYFNFICEVRLFIKGPIKQKIINPIAIFFGYSLFLSKKLEAITDTNGNTNKIL